MAAGLSPAEWWAATPSQYEAVMAGVRQADARDLERRFFTAWAVERFAREKKLKAFSRYAHEIKPKRSMGTAEIVAHFQAMQAAGMPVKIRKVSA